MKISCIMSNYKTEINMLRYAIDSILNQSYSDFEFIIVDDCSKDSSVEVLNEYAQMDKRIRLLFNDKNRGLAFSLNRAIAESQGEYIARMDTDDVSLKERFKRQVEYMDEHRDIDICGSFVRVFGDSNYYLVTPFYDEKSCRCQLLYSACLVHPSVLIRKKFLIGNNLKYNENFLCAQDFDMWTRCVEAGNIYMIPEILICYRVHSRQISTEKRAMQKNYAKEICLRQLAKMNIEEKKIDLASHMILCKLSEFDKSVAQRVFAWCNDLMKANQISHRYDPKTLKRVLNYRFNNVILQSNETIGEKLGLILKSNKFCIFLYFADCLKQRLLTMKLYLIMEKKVRNTLTETQSSCVCQP